MKGLSKAQYAELLKRQLDRQPGSASMDQMRGPMQGMIQQGMQPGMPEPNPMTELIPPRSQGNAVPQDPLGEVMAQQDNGPVGQLDGLEEQLWMGFYQSMPELQELGDPATAYNQVSQQILQGASSGDPDLDEFIGVVAGQGAPIVPGYGQVSDPETEAWTAFLSEGVQDGNATG